jgi:hypothetical protein
MDKIPRQGLRQLPRHNPRELSGFEVGAVYLYLFWFLLTTPLLGQTKTGLAPTRKKMCPRLQIFVHRCERHESETGDLNG